MANTYGVAPQGNYTDVSLTERGAKIFATRNGHKEVYIRFNSGYHIELVAVKQSMVNGVKHNDRYERQQTTKRV